MILELLFLLDSVSRPFDGLAAHYDSLGAAKRIELKAENKGKWLNYLPSAGVGFAPTVDENGKVKSVLRPSLSWNVGKLYDLAERKAERKNLLKAEIMRLSVERKADSLKIVSFVRKLDFEGIEDSIDNQIAKLDAEMFEVTAARYRDAKIPIDQYIAAQKAVLERKRVRAQRSEKRRAIEDQVHELCRC